MEMEGHIYSEIYEQTGLRVRLSSIHNQSLLYKDSDPGSQPSSIPFAFLLSVHRENVSLHLHAFSSFTLIFLSNGG